MTSFFSLTHNACRLTLFAFSVRRLALGFFAALIFLISANELAIAQDMTSLGSIRDKQGRSDPQLILNELKYDSQEDLEESQRSLQAALAFDPGNADYHFELSRVYGALYDDSARGRSPANAQLLNLSQNELEQVLMIRPNDVPARYNLGVIYKRRKNMERSRDEFRQVIKLSHETESASPVVVSAWLQIGATYEDQGFYEDAQDAYMKARKLGGPRPEIQSAVEDLRDRQHAEIGRNPRPSRGDSWTRQYLSGSDYTQFGSEALKAQSQSAGVGALVPVVGQLLFQQFIARRQADSKEV